MVIIIVLVILVSLVILTFFIVRHLIFMSKLKWHFNKSNIIIFGFKSSGKDLVTNKFINLRDEPYYANMPYTENEENYMHVEIKELSLGDNTPINFIDGEIKKSPHKFMESCNCYISDMGVYLPNYMDSKLYVKFPTLPIFYPLSSQTYDMNIIFNCQDIHRGWKALREQADYFIWTKRTIKIFGWLFTKVYCYEKFESAEKKLLPVKTRLLNKYSKAEVDIYRATNGEILEGFVIQHKKNIHYDTRYFEKVVLVSLFVCIESKIWSGINSSYFTSSRCRPKGITGRPNTSLLKNLSKLTDAVIWVSSVILTLPSGYTNGVR